jgi:hypothetical protein
LFIRLGLVFKYLRRVVMLTRVRLNYKQEMVLQLSHKKEMVLPLRKKKEMVTPFEARGAIDEGGS